jgi:putative transposase
MPWKNVCPMDNKLLFISEYLAGYFSVSSLCDRYCISRKTGYKWINRYLQSHAASSLENLSRQPHSSPNVISDDVITALLAIRDKHPDWGPMKLLWRLEKDHPDFSMPSYASVARILKRNGYIKKRRKRTRRPHPGKPLSKMLKPNDIWTADFKGHFRTLDGIYCYPLTVVDGFSRYILACQSMLAPKRDPVKQAFTRLFKEYGLPTRIRTDNGTPFASTSIARLSRLSVWWMRLGITPELIEPGCPQQNGRHERMHRTLKQATTIPPAADLKWQQKRFDQFINEFNYERPHQAIGMKPPADLYKSSLRIMPEKLPPMEYPAHYEVRRVSRNGGIRWTSGWVNLGQVLKEEYVGLVEIDDGVWDLTFGPLWLGLLDEKNMKIKDIECRLERNPKGRIVLPMS